MPIQLMVSSPGGEISQNEGPAHTEWQWRHLLAHATHTSTFSFNPSLVDKGAAYLRLILEILKMQLSVSLCNFDMTLKQLESLQSNRSQHNYETGIHRRFTTIKTVNWWPFL